MTDIWARLEAEIRKNLGWTLNIKNILNELKAEWDAILKHHITQEEGQEKQIRELTEKAEKWDELKPETKTILELATEYSYDDVMAGRLSPEYIKELLGNAFWEHGVQKGTWILEHERFRRRLEAIRTHLTKWVSGHSDWQMGRMSQWKKELDEIVEAKG